MDLETVVKACVAALVEVFKATAAAGANPFVKLAAIWCERHEDRLAKEFMDRIFNVFGPNPTREQIESAAKEMQGRLDDFGKLVDEISDDPTYGKFYKAFKKYNETSQVYGPPPV